MARYGNVPRHAPHHHKHGGTVASHDVVHDGTHDPESGFKHGGSVHHKRGGAVHKHGHVHHHDHVESHLKTHDRFHVRGGKVKR